MIRINKKTGFTTTPFLKKGASSLGERGFTLLFASLFSSLLLAIGIGIFNIVFKELILTASSKESQLAFYNADTGIECALYWDLRNSTFATSTRSNIPDEGILCASDDIATSWIVDPIGPNSAVTTFNLTTNSCATVTVTKSLNDTTIESRGYNTCDTSNPKRVERGIKVSY